MLDSDLSIAEQYIADVLADRILTSKQVRLQIERHQRDLVDGPARGLRFDREAAQHVIEFFPLFCIGIDGSYFGQPIILDPAWQALLWILYGWKSKDPEKDRWQRRFQVAYCEMGAGNLKSLILSCLCLYEVKAFGHMGANVYAAATDRKTARRIFDSASIMAEESDVLRRHLIIGKENICDPATYSKFEPCASEDQNLQGLRPSFVCIDELWAHKNSGVWDAFYTRLAKCDDPLLFSITNSGFDRESVCYKKREYSEKVLNGIVPDDSWFAWIGGVDDEGAEDFNWEDEKNWPKANPCWGTAVRLTEIRKQALAAKEDSSSLNAFLRLHLCIWTSSYSAWMPMDKWNLCSSAVDRAQLADRRCFGGLDLSTTTDISAFVLLFEPEGEDPHWTLLPTFFLPKDNIEKRCRRDRVPYDVWEKQGLFELTEGNIIDYRRIRSKINELGQEFNVAQIGYDRWNSTEIVTQLAEDDGFEMVKVGQGYGSMYAPTKRLLELVLQGALAHGGNPVLRWMASNVIVQTDPAGNIKPDKGRSREKIDGIVAGCMALSVAMASGGATFEPFVM